MIETIFSNENGDGEGTSRSQTAFKMPKNIRQIGKSNASKKIYVEDYVMSYVKQLASGDYSGCTVAVLVGQCIKLDNCRNIFISGAVKVKDVNISEESVFTNEIWTCIYEDIKKFFVETEIVGWYIGGPGYLLSEENKIQKIHIDNFAGQDKILLTYDNLEKEESFLSYENSRLSKLDGYYIYYEKNEEMQNYIMDNGEPVSCEADYEDKVSQNIRAVIQSKKTPEEENKSVTRLMYAAGTLLAVIVLIVGAAMLRNYDQMRSMQDSLNYLLRNMEEVQAFFADTDVSEDTDTTQMEDLDITANDTSDTENGTNQTEESSGNSLDVEVVPGNVEPIADSDEKSSDTSGKEDNDAVSDKELAADSKTTENAAASEEKTSSSNTEKKESSKETQKQINYYTVKEGDTLADISFRLYNTYTKVKTIMQLNEIDDQDLIFVGQKLIVP